MKKHRRCSMNPEGLPRYKCGGQAEALIEEGSRYVAWIECPKCGAYGPDRTDTTIGRAIKLAWAAWDRKG